MKIFIVVFLVFLIVVFGMSIGVIMGRRRISGSCGGVGSCSCENPCDNPCDKGSHKHEQQITFHK